MFKPTLSPILLTTFAAMLFSAVVFGQEGPPPMEGRRPPNDRPDILAQLGLSPEQVQQFRRLNAEHRPLMNDAQKRVRETTRDLDMAIYADVVNEDVVREKLKAFQAAHAEVNRLRFANELAIRKILTLEQLQRFREFRRRMADMNRQNQRQEDGPPMDRRPRREMRPMQNRDQVVKPPDGQKRPSD
jgi:Spy/CpxP family protein refolding chaperone